MWTFPAFIQVVAELQRGYVGRLISSLATHEERTADITDVADQVERRLPLARIPAIRFRPYVISVSSVVNNQPAHPRA
jgi:hypothetical protein